MSISEFLNLRKKLLLVSFLMFSSINFVLSQQKELVSLARNTFYIDLSTKGAIYSVNYDRVFHESDKITYSYRIGFSITEEAIALPVGINLFTGKGNSHAEFSLTVMPYMNEYKSFMSSNDLSDKYLYVIPAVGYRYQKPSGRLFLKVALSPMIILDPRSSNFWKMDPEVHFTGNIGLGWSF